MKTILALEDESMLMNLLRQILDQYRLMEATTAEQALQLFADHPGEIALLLADVTLPTSSGIEVALQLRASIPNLPVILTSGYPKSLWNAKDAADLKRLGADSVMVLQKPFGAQVLLSTVSRFIAGLKGAAGGNA